MPTDLQRMRKSRPASAAVAVSNTSSVAIPQSEDRVALVLPGSATQTVTWRYGNTASAGAGVFIAIGGPAVLLSLLLHGSLVKGPWSCITGTGAETLVYHEASSSEP